MQNWSFCHLLTPAKWSSPILRVTATPLRSSVQQMDPTRNTTIWCVYTLNLFANPTLKFVTETVGIHLLFLIWYCTIWVYERICMGASLRHTGNSSINIGVIISQRDFWFFNPTEADHNWFPKNSTRCLFRSYIALVCYSLYIPCISLNFLELILMLIINYHSNLFKILI